MCFSHFCEHRLYLDFVFQVFATARWIHLKRQLNNAFETFAGQMLAVKPGAEQCQVGSLTGAVASQNVTEAPKGSLSTVGNRAQSVKV